MLKRAVCVVDGNKRATFYMTHINRKTFGPLCLWIFPFPYLSFNCRTVLWNFDFLLHIFLLFRDDLFIFYLHFMYYKCFFIILFMVKLVNIFIFAFLHKQFCIYNKKSYMCKKNIFKNFLIKILELNIHYPLKLIKSINANILYKLLL